MYQKAEINDHPSWELEHEKEDSFDRPYHVTFDGVEHKEGFLRRSDASRFARKRALKIVHWYSI